MKRRAWPLALIACTAVGRLAAAAEQVPYVDGLDEGQGYNTFLQAGCRHDAVKITEEPSASDSPQVDVTYTAVRVSDYQQLLEELDVGAGATMSKLDDEADFDAQFLARDEFDESFLTYLVKVDVRRQPSASLHYSFQWTAPEDPREAYGDRFISDFVRGGALFARVSIITKDKAKHRQVDESARLAFSAFEVDAKVTQSIKASIDDVKKHSEIRIHLRYVGAPPEYQNPGVNDTDAGDDGDELLQLKDTADNFLVEAKSHAWKRFALLERYETVADFDAHFKPLDYSGPTDRSWAVFDDFSKFRGLQTLIRSIKPERFNGGRGKRDQLDQRLSDILADYKSWAADVSASPAEASSRPALGDPAVFRRQVLGAIRTESFVAQSIPMGNGDITDIIDTKLHDLATRRFDLEAYSHCDVPGLTKVTFVKKTNAPEYSAVVAGAVAPGYDVSELCVFAVAVNETIRVVAIPELASVQLVVTHGLPSPQRRQAVVDLFTFYAELV